MRGSIGACLVTGSIVVLGCSTRVPEPQATGARTRVSTPEETSDDEVRGLTPEESAGMRAMLETRAGARRSMVAHRYEEAVGAYEAALAAIPTDSATLLELGRAARLAKQYAKALDALHRAKRSARTATLRADVYDELALASREAGDLAASDAFRVRSGRPAPAATVRGKPHDAAIAPTCPLLVDRASVPGHLVDDWRALRRRYDGDAAPVTSEEEAKAALCNQGCDGPGPWIARVRKGDDAAAYALVTTTASGKLLAFDDVGEAHGGRCGYHDRFEVQAAGSAVIVRRVSAPSAPLYFEASTEQVQDCQDVDKCWSGCFAVSSEETLMAFDTASMARVVSVEQDQVAGSAGFSSAYAFEPSPDGIHVKGEGCDGLHL